MPSPCIEFVDGLTRTFILAFRTLSPTRSHTIYGSFGCFWLMLCSYLSHLKKIQRIKSQNGMYARSINNERACVCV